jgi:hypothetical protein
MPPMDFLRDVLEVKKRRDDWYDYAREAAHRGIPAPEATDARERTEPMPALDVRAPRGSRGTSWIAIAAFLALAATLAALLFVEDIVASGDLFIRLPILIVLGSLAFLTGVTFIVVVFARLDLDNSEHALGLPEGSVRALIALILIVIFFIFANSVFGTIQGQDDIAYEGLTEAEIDDIDGEVLRRAPSGQNDNGDELFDATIRVPNVSDEGIALGQQLVTALITLVAAISAFYFGSNSVKTAADAATRFAASAGAPDYTAVPNLVGLQQATAEWQLARLNLIPSITMVPSPDTAGRVVSQNPAAGAMVMRGDSVAISIGEAPPTDQGAEPPPTDQGTGSPTDQGAEPPPIDERSQGPGGRSRPD